MDVCVGDIVDIYSSNDTTIINLSKKSKRNKNNKILINLIKYCHKIFPIIFSSILVVCLITIIIISSIPYSKKYTYDNTIPGVKFNISITFYDNEMELMYNGSSIKELYYVDNEKLYIFDEGEEKYVEN